METTHYELLGVAERATPDEIRAAYEAHLLDFGANPGPFEWLEALNKAYLVLLLPEQRADYDRWLARQRAIRRHATAQRVPRRWRTVPMG